MITTNFERAATFVAQADSHPIVLAAIRFQAGSGIDVSPLLERLIADEYDVDIDTIDLKDMVVGKHDIEIEVAFTINDEEQTLNLTRVYLYELQQGQ
jgi:hypothetical protein